MEICIDKYSESDTEELYCVISESAEHLRSWMPWLHSSYSINNTRIWVNQCIDDWNKLIAFRYVIRNKTSNEILGAVGLERIVHAHRIAELGYWVSSKVKNCGVATSAGKLAIIQAFETHGINRIEINVLPDNIPSNKVALKVGGLLEGSFRNKLFHNGRSNSANSYSIIPADYKI